MAGWSHSICEFCWMKREGSHPVLGPRVPYRIKNPGYEICCFCGTLHHSGIYVREDPQLTFCKGACPEGAAL